ncbi:MAG: Type 1 glutamine amidotransferase-like domain-containing protein [Patescibacteria group bacterium]
MTKYILHGGETGIPNENNKTFYQEWLRDFEINFVPTVLLIYFARPIEEWEQLKNQDQERLEKYTNHRAVNLIIASSDPGELIKQLSQADIVYVRGGDINSLMSIMKPIKDQLLKILNNKTYVGSSAGVMMLAWAMRSNTTNWQTGFGLLPFNCFVHYSAERSQDLANFKNNNLENNFPYLLISETEFVVRRY